MRRVGWILGALAVAGCSGPVMRPAPWPEPTPLTQVSYPAEAPYQATSLWSDRAPLTRAFDDLRARRVGDLITVVVVETSEASRVSSTDVSRDASVSAQVTNFLGSDLSTGSRPGTFFEPKVSASTGNSFQGSGTTKHKEALRTRVAARVVDVLPDGSLVLEGRRQVQVHADTQYLYVRGIARTADVTHDNTVVSTDLADAQIFYGGTGLLADQQRPGWMYRVLDKVWPF
ncbi:MAG: flagellar basal body L-ring protein FlgH [Deferrisomatales bacterium]